jgi:hypothetical protein
MLLMFAAALTATPAPPPVSATPNRVIVRQYRGPDGKVVTQIPPEVRARMANCAQHKLVDTVFTQTVAGKVRKSRILLCAKPGASAAQTAAGLEQAIAAVRGNTQIQPSQKAEILAQLQAKLTEYRAKK